MQNETGKKAQNKAEKEAQEEAKKETQNEAGKKTQSEVEKEVQEEVKKETQNETGKKAQSKIEKQAQSEAARGKERIDWVDCARGIAILAVIVGHGVDGIWRAMIFSFHMPLFFLLSGRTSRASKDRKEWMKKIKKAWRQLIIPAIVVYLLRTGVSIWQDVNLLGDASYWKGVLCTFFFASGVEIGNSGIFGGIAVEAMGIPWFFFALFFGRSLYDYFHLACSKRQLLLLCGATSVVGVVLGMVQWLPFSLDIALAVQPFFYLGDWLKGVEIEKGSWKLLIVFGVVWLSTLALEYPDWSQWTYLELAWRRYPLYPLCYVTAAAGSLFCCEVSVFLVKLGDVVRPLLFLGKNSLIMLCIHIMDYLWHPLCYGGGPALFSLFLKLCVDSLIFLFVMMVRRRIKRC